MLQQKNKVELRILTETDVRDYAENRLPAEDYSAVEETLLEDDRARRLVNLHAAPIQGLPVAGEFKDRLRDVLRSCRGCIVSYELLSRAKGPETLKKFGASRFSERWRLLDEVARVAEPGQENHAAALKVHGNPIEKVGVADMVNVAREHDFLLAEALHEAFEATKTPGWKAQIAEWISAVRNDIGEILWLKSAFRTQ
ncbi:MAG: hypothetical protein AAFW68_01620 [Pseudomonadota bacterium]